MLTKDLLHFSTRQGRIKPRFIDPDNAPLLELAEALVATAKASIGEGQGDLEESLLALAAAAPQKKLGDGLVKLVLDRVEVEGPNPEAQAERLKAHHTASGILSGLPEGTTLAGYQAALDHAFLGRLGEVREGLYADLPARRAVKEVQLEDGAALLHRYNLALAQSFLLYAQRVVVVLESPPKLELRRVFRWLKFCRLVADIEKVQDNLQISVEGPAAMFASAKRYGLALAMFVEILPILPRWQLNAEVELPRRPVATLVLDQKLGLSSPLRAGLGHVPEEVESTLAKLESDELFELERAPEPRPIGVGGLLVPDLALTEKKSGRRVIIELFHPWHQGALEQRLRGLKERPDPELLLGVDRALAKDPAVKARLEDEAQVFLFNSFPGERVLKDAVRRWIQAEA